MATNIYDSCINPISGETFKVLSFDEDAYTTQWTVTLRGYVPFEHIHLSQDEIFHVKKGEVKVVMNGQAFIARQGESIRVPKGIAHIAYNNTEEILDCILE